MLPPDRRIKEQVGHRPRRHYGHPVGRGQLSGLVVPLGRGRFKQLSPRASVSPQPGVDACAEVGALSGAAEQSNQSGTLIAAESVENLAFETIDDGVGLIEQHTRSVSEANAMCTPIPGVALTAHQFATLQFVDEADHRIAMHPK